MEAQAVLEWRGGDRGIRPGDEIVCRPLPTPSTREKSYLARGRRGLGDEGSLARRGERRRSNDVARKADRVSGDASIACL